MWVPLCTLQLCCVLLVVAVAQSLCCMCLQMSCTTIVLYVINMPCQGFKVSSGRSRLQTQNQGPFNVVRCKPVHNICADGFTQGFLPHPVLLSKQHTCETPDCKPLSSVDPLRPPDSQGICMEASPKVGSDPITPAPNTLLVGAACWLLMGPPTKLGSDPPTM